MLLALVWVGHQPLLSSDVPLVVQVPAGSAPLTMLNSLDHHVRWPGWQRWYLRIFHRHPHVQTGEYTVTPGMSMHAWLEALAAGKVNTYRITLVAGWPFSKWRQRVNANPHLQHTLPHGEAASVRKRYRERLAALLNLPSNDLEGQFWPTTLHFPAGSSDVALYQRGHAMLQAHLAEAWSQRARKPALHWHTPNEALVVASLLERETACPQEMRTIAGVINHRLALGMPLQLDASVLFGTGRDRGPLSHKDFRTPGPYNTYLNQGLPPGPIGAVSAAALEAACHPEATPALYYVRMPDGQHRFSTTYRAHKEAIRHGAQVRRKRTKVVVSSKRR